MRRFLVRRSLADFKITTPELKFSVSTAVFYYLELQDLAKKRTRVILLIHELARRKATRKIGDIIIGELKNFWKRIQLTGGILSLRDARPGEKFRFKRIGWFNRLLFVVTSSFVIKRFARLTHIFVAISTTTSLGSLLYAGFNPGTKIGCGWMITLLAMSYISVFWTLTIYLFYIPLVGRAVRRATREL